MHTSNSSTKPNRLLIIIPDLETGGGERVTRQIIDEFGMLDYRIRLIADVPDHICYQLPLQSHRALHWKRKIKSLVIIARELFHSRKDTTIITVLTGPIIAVGTLNWFFRRRVIAYEHSDLERLYLSGKGIRKKLRLHALRLASKSLTRIAVVSEYLANRTPYLLGCEIEKVAIVRNPVQPFHHKLRCSIISDPKAPITAYIIGRNSSEKRHLAAITLLAATEQVENIILVCRHGDPIRLQLTDHANKKLLILDNLAEINHFNDQCSFLFSYSAAESYSLVIAEWLASQLPIITVDEEPMRLLWEQWRGSYFIPTESNTEDLEATIFTIKASENVDKRIAFKPVNPNQTVRDFEILIKP